MRLKFNSLLPPSIMLASLCWLGACSKKNGQTSGLAHPIINPADFDTTVSPCQNFWQYANGGWLKAHPIPASESSWGSFSALADSNISALHQLLEESAKSPGQAGSISQKVGDFYASGMDSTAIEQAGINPLKPILARIDAIQTPVDVQNTVAYLQTVGLGPLFTTAVGQDDKKSDEYAFFIYQGGLGLPDREYYLRSDAKSDTVRKAYHTYLVNILKLAGEPAEDANKGADDVFKLEKQLALASKPRKDLRDPYANYNKMTVAELDKLAPRMNWRTFVDSLGATGLKEVIVGQPKFLQAINTALGTAPVTVWRQYLKAQLITNYAPTLSSAFVNEQFHMYGQVLNGQKAQRPRWKRVSRTEDRLMGELVGEAYVKKHFTPAAKQQALAMVKNLEAAFGEHIDKLDWMSDSTKHRAHEKLKAIVNKIGFPDKWRDYSKLQVVQGSYAENVLRAERFEYERNLGKLGKPIDREEWLISPPTVNAYYNPGMNEIVFPAGILQPPFYDPNADDAINYGGIGGVIGHEFTHGFDDQGRQYNAQGNLKDWWTAADAKRFDERASLVKKQYSAYTVEDSLHVNGELTLGENLADLGGIAIAYSAFQKTEEFKKGEKLEGFTPAQRFFLGWAHVWATQRRPESMRQLVLTDPHSPSHFRANGPLSNMPEFYEAWGCKEGDAMVRPAAARAKVW